jgi:lysophospholipase L1-like esterase
MRKKMIKNKKGGSSVIFLVRVLIMLALYAVPSLQAGAAPLKIMCLGDSITAGQGCWRAYLWNKLQTNGYTNIDFVGSVVSGGCPLAFDEDCEGHGGFSATGIADNDQLPPWLSAANPDIVLMHLGTNDMWGGYIPLEDKLAAFTKLVGQMRANNPNMKIIVAQIIPMSASACATCPADVVTLDNAIPGWAASLTTSQSPITVVDQWTGFNADTDTRDGVHPNDTGEQKMAEKWYPPLAAALSGSSPTNQPTTVPTTAPTLGPTGAPGGGRGDANGNGTVDIVDALLIAQDYVGLAPAGFIPANADANCSGSIDIVDALLVAQYYVGLISGFPC